MKHKTTLIVILLMSLISSSCETGKKGETDSNEIDPNSALCLDYSKDAPSELPVDLIFDMVKNYDTLQLDAIKKSNNFREHRNHQGIYKDAQVIWFDLDTLKKFIYHIETETKERDPTVSTKNLGIHIYYSTYPPQRYWDKSQYQESLEKNNGNLIVPREYEQKHTLIMVPTIEVNKFNIDFNPTDEETFAQGLRLIKDDSSKYSPGSFAKIVSIGSYGERTDALNHGGLFPPGTTNGLHFITNN